MDKKLNKDLEDFFYGNPKTWDKILKEDTHRKKGEIGSCCSFHALEQFVSYYDPTGKKKEFSKIKNCKYESNINENCRKADLIILHTEWDEFKIIDFKKINKNKYLKIYDLRNLYSIDEMRRKKINYYSVGRPTIK